jgi:hypothetical protein
VTIEQHIAKLKKQRDGLVSGRDKALRVAALDTNAIVSNRIFTGGKSSNGSIGSYSTRATLATRSQFTRKSAFKQTGWIKFPKAKRAVPVMELKGGYKQLRSIQGKGTGSVNLDYSGALMKDFSNSVRPFKKGYAAIVKQNRSATIINAMERKYKNRIFFLSKAERQHFKNTLNIEFLRWTSKP